MASQIRRLISSSTPNLFTRSILRFQHPATSESRLPSSASHRSPKSDLRSFHGVYIKKYTTSITPAMEQITPSISLGAFTDKEGFKFYLTTPGHMKKTESDDNICVYVNMPGITYVGDVKLSLKRDNSLIIEGYAYNGVGLHVNAMRFPENVDRTSSGIKGEIVEDGMFKLTLPKSTNAIRPMKKSSIFRKAINFIKFKLIFRSFASLPSVFMLFGRSYVRKIFCSFSVDSFSIYKEETAYSLNIKCVPGLEKSERTREGICVSVNMPELKIEDVKSYFKHEALFIEGKTKTKTKKVHYITCICSRYSVVDNWKIIRTEMQDGIYKAIICDGFNIY